MKSAFRRHHAPLPCHVGLYLGLDSLSYVRVTPQRDGAWELVDHAYLPLSSGGALGMENSEQVQALLSKLSAGEDKNTPVHISLHGRYCVSSAISGTPAELVERFQRIESNSHHYLQMGLGQTLIGTAELKLDSAASYGQAALIKRSLIEQIEASVRRCGLNITTIEGGMTGICRLAGYALMDDEPLLIVWQGRSGCEIGISYQGKMLLHYHAGKSATTAETACTVRRHLKRMRQFCAQHVGGGDEANYLNRVLVLAGPQHTKMLADKLSGFGFRQILDLSELYATPIAANLGEEQLGAPGVVAALGGLIAHLEHDQPPIADIYDQYLALKPRTFWQVLVQDGIMVMVAAIVLCVVTATNWWTAYRTSRAQATHDNLAGEYSLQHDQVMQLDDRRRLLHEYTRLAEQCTRTEIEGLLGKVAGCLPDDTRIETLLIDTEHRLVLKGTMLYGDQTYDVLRALRTVPNVGEVSLESVGHASDFGESATQFEIQCELVGATQPQEQQQRFVAKSSAGDNIQ